MKSDIFVALVASLSALGGSIIGIAGSLILARFQSRHQDFRELRDTRLKAHQDLARGLAELISEIKSVRRSPRSTTSLSPVFNFLWLKKLG